MQCRIWFSKKAKNDKRRLLEPSIKYVMLEGKEGGLRRCDSLWQGEGESRSCDVTLFKFFLSYILNLKLKMMLNFLLWRMYSDRNVTSRPIIVILGIKFFLSFFLNKVMGSRLYMCTVVRHIVSKMLVIVLCALLWKATSADHPAHVLSFRGVSVSHGRQLRCSGVGRRPYSSCSWPRRQSGYS